MHLIKYNIKILDEFKILGRLFHKIILL